MIDEETISRTRNVHDARYDYDKRHDDDDDDDDDDAQFRFFCHQFPHVVSLKALTPPLDSGQVGSMS